LLTPNIAVDTFRYIVGVLLVVGLPPGFAWWLLVHPFIGFWRRLGVRLALIVLGAFLLASVLGLLTIRETLLGADLGFSWPLFAVGVLLIVAAAWISLKRRKHLTMRILAGLPELEAEPDKQGVLLEKGPYAVIRHPRYVEVVLATFAYAAVANYAGCWLLVIAMLPVLHLVVVLEERELRERFGDAYRDYAARVPRYIPRLGG
jgi:protein-S-isoprenylcysteine O-methyltransferase Ste14